MACGSVEVLEKKVVRISSENNASPLVVKYFITMKDLSRLSEDRQKDTGRPPTHEMENHY